MKLHDYLDYWATRRPRAEFVVDERRTLGWAKAAAESRRMAAAFRASGLRRGDRVVILAPNCVEYLLAYLAASRVGIVLVPLNWRLAAPELVEIINDAAPRAVIAAPPHVETVETIRRQLQTPRLYIAVGPTPPGWVPLDDVARAGRSDTLRPDAEPSDDLYQMYSSGTTGRPKGAVLTHAAVTANITQIGLATGMRPGERSLVVSPMFHAAVIPSALSPIAHGGCVRLLERFDPAHVLRLLAQEPIAIASLVPSMIHACLQEPPGRTATALRLIYYGASPISEKTLRAALDRFGCDFIQSYGLTETAQALTFLHPEDHRRALRDAPRLLLSAGTAAAGTDLRVVDGDGAPLANNAVGEIVARGPQLMRGYWRRPAETADALRDGWLHTGDLGRLDDDGYLYVQDRIKDIIISGGENVSPRAVEAVLWRHEAVADVAVIGVPDERWGEAVKAVVVLAPGARVDEQELLSYCRGDLGGFECPRSVDFVADLPRNPSGKVLKRVLRAPYWRERERQVAGA